MVYEKSALGYNEFVNEKRTLHFKERQVLLLMNGIRSLDDLEKLFAKEQLLQIIHKLETQGYIQSIGGSNRLNKATPYAPASIADIQFTTIDTAKLSKIKSILIESIDDYLGLMGRSIRTQVEACHDETSLKSCLSIWHMAMRESKLGRESASFLMGDRS